jgi:hypothetical protein
MSDSTKQQLARELREKCEEKVEALRLVVEAVEAELAAATASAAMDLDDIMARFDSAVENWEVTILELEMAQRAETAADNEMW